MKHFDRLIFVDSDDTTRAPMAAGIMKNKYLLGPLEIFSRGLIVLFPEPVNQKTEAVMASKGLSIKDHTASQLRQSDITARTLIITMEDAQKDKIWSDYLNAANVYTLSEYIGIRGDLGPLYGEPLPSYGKTFEALEAMVSHLVIRLNEDELRRDKEPAAEDAAPDSPADGKEDHTAGDLPGGVQVSSPEGDGTAPDNTAGAETEELPEEALPEGTVSIDAEDMPEEELPDGTSAQELPEEETPETPDQAEDES